MEGKSDSSSRCDSTVPTPKKQVEELTFYLNKLAETESTLRKMMRFPQNFQREDFIGVMSGFEMAIQMVDEFTRIVKVPAKTPERYALDVLLKNFARLKDRLSKYRSQDMSKAKFKPSVGKRPPPATIKVPSPITAEEEKSKPSAFDFVEMEVPEYLPRKAAVLTKEEQEMIEETISSVKDLTNQMAVSIDKQGTVLKEAGRNVEDAKTYVKAANRDIVRGASGKDAFFGWRTRWGGMLGLIGAGIGTIIAPVIGTGIGGAFGAALGVKIGGTIEDRIDKAGMGDGATKKGKEQKKPPHK